MVYNLCSSKRLNGVTMNVCNNYATLLLFDNCGTRFDYTLSINRPDAIKIEGELWTTQIHTYSKRTRVS